MKPKETVSDTLEVQLIPLHSKESEHRQHGATNLDPDVDGVDEKTFRLIIPALTKTVTSSPPIPELSKEVEQNLLSEGALFEEDIEEILPQEQIVQPGWYDEVFASHYAAVCLADSEVEGKLDVGFMLQLAKLPPAAKILDVGCGDGCHSLAFAALGFSVTGVDLSPDQLQRAEINRRRLNQANCSFIKGDMRMLPKTSLYDAVTCLGATFGYFGEEQNRQCLIKMRDQLRPAGKIILQVPNRDYLAAALPCRSWWRGRGCLVLDVAELDFFHDRLKIHRTIVFEDGRQFEHQISIRIYTPHEISEMLTSLNMKINRISGSRSVENHFFGASSPDIWIFAERTA